MYNMTTSLVEDRSPPGYAAATRTEIGSRPSQQDRVLICGGDGELFAFLCDGMGGTAQGEMASQRTADILCKLFSDADTSTEGNSPTVITAAITILKIRFAFISLTSPSLNKIISHVFDFTLLFLQK